MIRDQNRSRRVYSFFRARPVPLDLTTVVQIISGSSGGGSSGSSGSSNEVLTFPNIAALAAYDVTAETTGRLAFVESVRDYFSLEMSSMFTNDDNITVVSSPSALGYWFRLELSSAFWRNATSWYVDPVTGDDENDGTSITGPLRTADEFERRVAVWSSARFGGAALFATGSTTVGTTPLTVFSYPQPPNSVVKYEANLVAISGSSTEGARSFIEATFLKGSSVLSLIGAQQSGADITTNASSWGASLAPLSGNVILSVTGSSLVKWTAELTVERVDN